jgi:ubiquitin-conjugating enzyme E2 Q
VPFCAASISRSFIETVSDEQSHKRRKSTRSSISLPGTDAFISDNEEDEDIAFLLSDDEPTEPKVSKTKKNASKAPLTNFVPGSLDQSQLPTLKEPEYATPVATKALNRALKDVLEVQKNTPLHDLGWYIDVNLIDNVYQWIVELHSFDPELPLAKDMKSAGVTSVVMEIRFPADYPFSPPFLRVIRPRFLPFTQGGGGHVTSGGAMCMELLTTSGWSAVSSIEGILLQVRLAMANLEPKPARLEGLGQHRGCSDYAVGEAMTAYIRACQTHGWTVPASFKELAAGSVGTY